MPVRLTPIALSEKDELRADFDPYLIAHADLVDPSRLYGDPTDYPHFDLYWTEPERSAWWIVADGRRAGFVLLNAYAPSGQAVDRAISEFCIVPAFRRSGIGTAAALAALATRAGQWELQVYRANLDGMAFWPRVLAAAPITDQQQIDGDDRVVHRFIVPPA